MKNNPTKIIIHLARNSFVQHIAFWALCYYMLLIFFSAGNKLDTIDYVYTGAFISTIICSVYVNIKVMFPYLLSRDLKWKYLSGFIINILIFSYINELLFSYAIDYIIPGFYFISYYSYLELIAFFTVFNIVATQIKFTKDWFMFTEKKQQLTELEKMKTEIELKGLKSQINPHFLFNSLNLIYYLSRKDSIHTQSAVLKLSDILRYVIYDSKSENVSLNSEITLIKNYIDLQKLRSKEQSNIKFNYPGNSDSIKISPLLLLPLVENSFKHGLKGDVKNTYIKIDMVCIDNKFRFVIQNNKGEYDDIEKKWLGGIGLNNIKQRLELIYPEKYSFDISENDNNFKVILNIDLI